MQDIAVFRCLAVAVVLAGSARVPAGEDLGAWQPLPKEFKPAATAGTLTAAKTEQIKTYRLKHKLSGQPALVYWLGVPMATTFQPARVALLWPGAEIAQPVLVDLLDGGVYAMPHEIQSEELRMVNLPLADSPLVLCSRSAVVLAGQ